MKRNASNEILGLSVRQSQLFFKVLEQFLAKPGVAVLEATQETAEYFGMIKAALKKTGRPIPLNDVWIAAHALETASILVTYDARFAAVPGLRTWDERSFI